MDSPDGPMLQYLLVKHGRFPGEFRGLPPGEQLAVRALFYDYLERREES